MKQAGKVWVEEIGGKMWEINSWCLPMCAWHHSTAIRCPVITWEKRSRRASLFPQLLPGEYQLHADVPQSFMTGTCGPSCRHTAMRCCTVHGETCKWGTSGIGQIAPENFPLTGAISLLPVLGGGCLFLSTFSQYGWKNTSSQGKQKSLDSVVRVARTRMLYLSAVP